MNKTELIGEIAKVTELSKVASGKALDAMLEAISKSLQKGEDVVLTGFGTFSIRDRPARTGHNPKTREAMEIKASKTPIFKAGKTLRDGIK
ncbi:MAG: HU family DNA-binding protein [Candidatus Competibacteraceae bacterium]|nr:HU family DNA-binding protein [Candidatus Competibacteraceae bacterium]